MTPARLSLVSLLLLALAGGFVLAGARPAAVPDDRARAELPIDADARAEARWIYETRCAWCHGAEGRGDGDGARDLAVPAGDLRASERIAGDHGEYIETIILQGGSAVGRSALMPPNPDLKAKPQVVTALRELVRELGRAGR